MPKKPAPVPKPAHRDGEDGDTEPVEFDANGRAKPKGNDRRRKVDGG